MHMRHVSAIRAACSSFSFIFEVILMDLTEEIRARVCRRCDFYKEDETLECAAFKTAKRLVEQGKVSLDEI